MPLFVVLMAIMVCIVFPVSGYEETVTITHPHTWNISYLGGSGNYTNISAISDLGDGDTIRIWGVEGHTYEGGVVIDKPNVTVERWDGSPAQPLITNTSGYAPAFPVAADNATFRGLNISGNQLPGYGAGINAVGMDSDHHIQRLTIADCTFAGNQADYGALYARYVDDLSVEGTAFTDNTAGDYGDGGGAYFESCTYATLTDCTFTGNTAGDDGGGAYFDSGCTDATLTDCTFTDNTASYGGGAYFACTNATVTNVTFTGNTAATYGGGAYFDSCTNATVTDCTFTGNTATNYYGGGVYFDSGCTNATVTNATFTGNVAGDSGGGAEFDSCNYATVSGATFTGNTAQYGGGADFEYTDATVTDATFTNNTAATYGGGAEFYDCTNATLTDCTFTGNTAGDDGGGAYLSGENATVSGATFTGNTATNYGGGAYFDCTSATVTAFTAFTGNNASYGGGAYLYCYNATVTGATTFTGNNASYGGGAYFDGCTDATVTNCRFDNPTNIYAESSTAVLNTTRTLGTNIAGGPYLGGNLWLQDPAQNISEWCADDNLDGICDEPLTINNNDIGVFGTDFLPLVYGGTLSVNSTPAGASVYLDGVNISRTTNTSIYLPAGEHNVTVTLDGYVTPENQTVTVVPGATTEVSFELEHECGALAVSSAPAGARIVLDGTDTGTLTYSTLSDVPTGEHNVTVTLAGYVTPANRTVTITTGETTEVSFELERGFGSLAVSSLPAGARIVLDGTDTGTLTYSTLSDVPTGDYNVTVTLDGYVTPANRTVTITTDETVPVSFVLEAVPTPTPGSSSSSGSGGESSDIAASSASSVPAGGNVSLTFSGQAIYEIRVTAADDIPDLLVTIEESGLPAGVSAPAETVYEYDEVTLYHTTDGAVEGALVLFKIPKSWLEENGLDAADVVLYRYHDGEWQALPTDVVGEDATFRYFSAQSPGFSLFAIGGGKTPVAVETTAAGAQAGTTEAVQSVTTVETTSPTGAESSSTEAAEPFPITLLICGAAFLIVAAVVLQKRG